MDSTNEVSILLRSPNIDAHTVSGVKKVLKYGGKIGGGGGAEGKGKGEEGGQLCNTSRQQPVDSDFCNNIVRCRGQFCKPNHTITHLFCFFNLTVFPQQLQISNILAEWVSASEGL